MDSILPQASPAKIQPRIIIHGGAGNISRATLTPERRAEFRASLLDIITKSHTYMTTPLSSQSQSHTPSSPYTPPSPMQSSSSPMSHLPNALQVASYAIRLLEDDPLFNAGRGAVFTRDGIIELEASVMVSRADGRTPWPKRAVGVSGLRRVKNPILLAKEILERGADDLAPPRGKSMGKEGVVHEREEGDRLNVPSAQGHTHLHGRAAEQLAEDYGLELVDPSYFYTERRWRDHLRGLERERQALCSSSDLEKSSHIQGTASWHPDEYLPQGTVGAVALDSTGVICVATSTGGLTNKVTGRIGDTPTVGAGFWAEEWVEQHRPHLTTPRPTTPAVILSDALKGLLADCLPIPHSYLPFPQQTGHQPLTTTRAIAVSGTGNGDSFLRTGAARTVGAIARFAGDSGAVAVAKVTGPGGELQRSAGDRWGKTGEGEGGMVGIEVVVTRDDEGNFMDARSELLQEYNCGGMFRAWVDEKGVAVARVFRDE
ncbi:hypothetical protein VTJ04DRAFT_10301 [Mycothermus thermophilus]|uniref:uncharacterized protein n=1 Tax=Humicola insolens TaxID=85995 RepID=UPI0037429B34